MTTSVVLRAFLENGGFRNVDHFQNALEYELLVLQSVPVLTPAGMGDLELKSALFVLEDFQKKLGLFHREIDLHDSPPRPPGESDL